MCYINRQVNIVKIERENFEKLYCKFGPMVYRRCMFILKDESKALDAMQDVFVRILEKSENISEICSSFFFTTATRVCLNQIRSDKYRNSLQIDGLAESIEDCFSAKQEEITNVSLLLDIIFSERDSKDREIAILYFVDEFTLEETAKQMKMSVSGVRKRISALKKYAGDKYGKNS